jgi:hypothetical protein
MVDDDLAVFLVSPLEIYPIEFLITPAGVPPDFRG